MKKSKLILSYVLPTIIIIVSVVAFLMSANRLIEINTLVNENKSILEKIETDKSEIEKKKQEVEQTQKEINETSLQLVNTKAECTRLLTEAQETYNTAQTALELAEQYKNDAEALYSQMANSSTTNNTPDNTTEKEVNANWTNKGTYYSLTLLSYNEYQGNISDKKDGYTYYQFEFEVEKLAGDEKLIDRDMFNCYADGLQIKELKLSRDGYLFTKLTKGHKARGYLYYAIPNNTKHIEFEFEDDYIFDKFFSITVK